MKLVFLSRIKAESKKQRTGVVPRKLLHAISSYDIVQRPVKRENTTEACDVTTAQTKSRTSYDINQTLLEGFKLSLTARRNE
jgi:hypothetical protein